MYFRNKDKNLGYDLNVSISNIEGEIEIITTEEVGIC